MLISRYSPLHLIFDIYSDFQFFGFVEIQICGDLDRAFEAPQFKRPEVVEISDLGPCFYVFRAIPKILNL